jgi:hypothetical protein
MHSVCRIVEQLHCLLVQLVVFVGDKPYTIVIRVFNELVSTVREVYVVGYMRGKHWPLDHFHSEVGEEQGGRRVTADEEFFCFSQLFDEWVGNAG